MSFISNVSDFRKAFEKVPLIGILRGVKAEQAEEIATAAVEGGFRVIEIPLNSPEPFVSIGRIAHGLAGRAVIGAGTVLSAAEVESVAAAGGQIVVSPNIDQQVVAKTKALGLVSAPGIMTPSEAFAGIAAGADLLKLFPGELLPLNVISAFAAVLPRQIPLVLVGGVSVESMSAFAGSPISGFGIGSGLYKPGMAAAEVRERAQALVAASRRAGFGKA